tara:strand:+ start:8432 stop:8680 length:249 start_codon:yes stop_codon:yes gene_type:complete
MEIKMIKFEDGLIVFTRTIKNNKGKLHIKLTYPDNGSSFWQVKTMFYNREDYIRRSCKNKNFPNNTVTDEFFKEWHQKKIEV